MAKELDKNPRGDFSRGEAESTAEALARPGVSNNDVTRDGAARLERVARENLAKANKSIRGER